MLNNQLTNFLVEFYDFLRQNSMFYSLALCTQIQIKIDNDVPLAAMSAKNGKRNIYLNGERFFELSKNSKYFVLLHELNHFPQLANKETLKDWIVWPEELNDTQKHKILNIAMDTALNQNVLKLIDITDEELSTTMMLPKTLKEHFNVDSDPYESWFYYTMKILEAIQDEKLDPEKFKDFELDIDLSDMTPEEIQKLKELLDKSQGLCVKMKGYGNKSADEEIFGDPKEVKLHEQFKKILKSLKFRINKIISPSNETDFTLNKINRKYQLLPGDVDIEKVEPQIVIVLDTSGSVFETTIFSKMVAISKELQTKNTIKALYCCDTELYRIDFNSQQSLSKIVGIGGGGTTLNMDHVNKIKQELRLGKTKLELIYITDEDVCLRDIKNNPKEVKLHIININKDIVK